MATDKPTIFDIETINALATRLYDHADSIENITAHEMEKDLRLAAAVCANLAGLRFRVGEIAEACLTQDPGVTRRDLLAALAEAGGRRP